MKSPEIRNSPETAPEKIQELKEFIESVSAETEEKYNVPLLSNGRIDMSAFGRVYQDTDDDAQRVREWQIEWHGDMSEEEIEKKLLRADGERLEMLAYAIFYKNLQERFIVARSSYHDDRKNKVDTILLDRETGNLVCAFDEVGSTSGLEYQKKQEAVLDRNKNNQGANLKYGLKLEKKDGKMNLVLGEVKRVPIFYIALPKDRIDKGINNFVPSASEQSDFEKRLFQYFIASIDAQIKGLELFSGRLEDELKDRLKAFGKMVDSLKKHA